MFSKYKFPIVIDDIMMIAIARHEANSFFHFINALHERTSFISTTNKSPKEWLETIGDEVITTALLDRLLYRCEIKSSRRRNSIIFFYFENNCNDHRLNSGRFFFANKKRPSQKIETALTLNTPLLDPG